MTDDQEVNTWQLEKAVDRRQAILTRLRGNVPQLISHDELEMGDGTDLLQAMRSRVDNLLTTYPEQPGKSLVTGLVSEVLAVACSSYGFDPLEVFVQPKARKGHHIAAAGVKKFGNTLLKQISLDPEEIMFRVQILAKEGVSTAKNITDLIFAVMHEAAHLGQAVYDYQGFVDSKQFEYDSRPTEIHADEVALRYCENLLECVKSKKNSTEADAILLHGLPQTIKEAKDNRRPRM